MEGVISLKKVLETMYNGDVFSFRVVTYDKQKRKRSGRIVEYSEAQLLWLKKTDAHDTAVMKLLRESEETADVEELKRNPAHRDNQTLNVRIYVLGKPTPKIVKIHPILLLMFNGQKVVL